MNYRLINTHFTKLIEKTGLIENNTNGFIEIVITEENEKPETTKSTTICPNGKMLYSLNDNQSIRGISISRVYSMINVLPLSIKNIGNNIEIDNKTLIFNKEGKLGLFGFDDVKKENMRLKTILLPNGNIGLEWYEPSSSEGNIEDIILELNNKIDKSDIMTLEQAKSIIAKYKGE